MFHMQVLSFLLMFELIPLAIWTVLFLFMKWNTKLVHSTTQAHEEDEATLK